MPASAPHGPECGLGSHGPGRRPAGRTSLVGTLLQKSPVRRRVSLVYALMDGRPRLVPMPSSLACAPADAGWTDRLFAADRARHRAFHGYLERGYRGLYLHDAGGWAAYGWASPAGTPGPPHLADGVADDGADWLFAFHTLEPYRNRGLYRALLGRLALDASRREPTGRVLVDAEPRNLASRRAIVAVGFEPAGVATTCIVGVPKLRWWRWGRWYTDRPHPPLPERPR